MVQYTRIVLTWKVFCPIYAYICQQCLFLNPFIALDSINTEARLPSSAAISLDDAFIRINDSYQLSPDEYSKEKTQ